MQEHRERQLDTQNHLRNDKSVKGILNKEDKNQCYPQRNQNTDLRVDILDMIRLTENTRKDRTCRHQGIT